MKKLFIPSLILLLAVASSRATTNAWAYFGANGNLAYQTWGNGNQIMDFSSAGYMGGGVALPVVATVQTLNPSGGDDTSALQSAINSVAGLSPVNGFRGALQLGPGTFYVSGQINLNASGVVVRGSGSGVGGTTIVMTNVSPFTLFNLSGSGSPSKSGTVSLTDPYVPSGTTTFNVSSASGFSVGNTVLVSRTVTTNWIDYLGMEPGGGELATNQNWISAGTVITTDRTIRQISGNQITLDVPLTDSFDTNYLGIPAGTMSKYSWSGRISHVGLEHLQIKAPATNAPYTSVAMAGLIDSWVRDIAIQDGVNAFTVQSSAKRVTVDSVNIVRTLVITGDPPADYTCSGTQILFNKCQSSGTGVWPFVTQGESTGPIVLLGFYTSENGGISPHQRWTVGILSDNCSLPDAPSGTQGISYRNRSSHGSGQGWTTGWSVAWNVLTPYFLVSAAPGTENWCIGGIGAETTTSDPNGIYDHLGSIVTPHSLYLEQLKERLGGAAVENAGYSMFTISNSPPVRTIAAGTNTTFAVTIGDPTLMSNVVALTVGGLPANASASFSTNSVTGAGGAILTVTALNSVLPGAYILNVIGASAGLTHTSQVSLVVGTFSLSASPASQTVLPGNGTSYTIIVATNNSFSGGVNLGVSGLPSGAAGGFNPASLNGNGSSTLSVTTTGGTLPGNYPLTIYGTNGSVVAVTTATLIIGGGTTSPLWTGDSATGNYWNDSANWDGVTLASGDALIFDGNLRLNNTNNTTAGTIYSNIVFNPGAGAFIIGGNAVTLGGNITNNSPNPQAINIGLNFSTNLTFNGANGTLILGNGLTNTFGAPGSTTLTFDGTGILADLLKSPAGNGGTNVILLDDSAANWTLEDNASSAAVTVPWVLEVNSGTFNFGDADNAPALTSTTAQGLPSDNQVGSVSGAAGVFNMVNGTFTTSARLNTGVSGSSTGIVNQVGGTLNIGSMFQGANSTSGSGMVSIVTVSGGTMSIGGGTGPLYVASRGTGTLTVTGSGVVSCGKLDISRNALGNTVSSAGTVNLNGGALMVQSVTNVSANAETGGSPTATFNFNGGTLSAKSGAATEFFQGSIVTPVTPITTIVRAGGAIIDDGGNAITIAEPLQHDVTLGGELDGGLTKLNTGALTLTAASTYNGDTTISNGTVALSGNGSISNSASVIVNFGTTLDASARSDATLTVASGQTLTGNGTVKGNAVVANGATLAPGGSLTTLVFNNNLTLNSGSTTILEVTHSPLTNDAAQVAGSLHYGGTLAIANVGTIALAAGDSFKLFSAASYSGAFTNITPVIPDVNLAWNTNKLTNGVLSIVSSPTPRPQIRSVGMSGGNFVFNGTNGVPNWPVSMLASTNIALPLIQWTVIATNNFDANGNCSFTNAADPNAVQSYYLLKLN